MGCDIHICTEKKVDFKDKHFWWCCDYFQLNLDHYLFPEEDYPEYEVCEVYVGQDYRLFEILAGVRGDMDEAIDEPRGLPNDVSPTVKLLSDGWDIDGHSHSWFTVRELFEADKKYKDPSLHYFVKKIKKRMCKEFGIFKFIRKPRRKRLIDEYSDKFRVIFWFDN